MAAHLTRRRIGVAASVAAALTAAALLASCKRPADKPVPTVSAEPNEKEVAGLMFNEYAALEAGPPLPVAQRRGTTNMRFRLYEAQKLGCRPLPLPAIDSVDCLLRLSEAAWPDGDPESLTPTLQQVSHVFYRRKDGRWAACPYLPRQRHSAACASL